MKSLYAALIAATLMTVACGESTTTPADGGTTPTDGGSTGPRLDTPARIDAYLEGKTLTMEGANIPTSPNGYSQDVNYGAASQCYRNTVIKVGGSNFTVSAQLGTVRALDGGTPATLERGLCDKTTGDTFGPITSTVVAYNNVKGNAECFDIDITFASSASQEGRGAFVDGGVNLELFFKSQYLSIRCADGNPGSGTAKFAFKGADGGITPIPFTGDALQRYVISQ